MNSTTLIRLTLAKAFLIKAQNALRQGNDDLSLATAVVDMHDSLDNLLGAVASELNTDKPSKDYMTSRFLKVEEKYTAKYAEPLLNKTEVFLLNEMRNGVKHDGILPNTAQVISTVKLLVDFSNQISKKVFGVRLEDISLVSQIKDKDKRKVLHSIEKDIEADDFRQGMLKASLALFKYLDSHAWNLSPLQNVFASKEERDAKNVFPKRDNARDDLLLLQYGIDPYLYHRFKNLVPEIGYDNLTDRKLIRKYPPLTWHDKNWTAENARFCLSFLTKLFLGQQRDYGGYHIVHRRNQDKVTFLRDSEVQVGLGETKTVVYQKGQELFGIVDGFINGHLLGYREGAPNHLELTEIDIETHHYEKYLIDTNDVSIETIAEEYEDAEK